VFRQDNINLEIQNLKRFEKFQLISRINSVTNDMTDEITQPTQPPPNKKPPSANTRGPNRRSVSITSTSKQPVGGSTQGPRPSSRTGNKKTPASAPSSESGPDATMKKSSDSGKKPEQLRNKNPVSASRAPAHRKAQPSASQGGRNSSPSVRQSSTPVPQSKEASDALSSLQRVIADLKTTSPVQPPAAQNNGFAMPAPQHQSNLPPNAPVFQPGAPAYPGSNADPKHRKAVSLGAAGLSGNFNSFSPHLGAMVEDAEDGVGGVFEEGEIQEHYLPHQGHQPRSQSQSFMAPRFAALAAQQEQSDTVGPTGRPQLAPNFMFGARKQRGTPLGPPINEEDLGFQFPQQQPQQQQQPQNYHVEFPTQEQTHKKSDSGEITGIMAEQVVLFLPSTSSALTIK
jgi:protein SSD1